MLLVYWQKRLGLERTKPAEALRRLRGHDEPGPVLAQLELWLHHPTADVEVDLAQLLEPYRDLRTEEPAAVPQTAGADHD